MNFFLSTFLLLGLASIGHTETPTLPPDVIAFNQRLEDCIHFSGEEPYDKARAAELNKAIQKSCPGLKKEDEKLRQKYQGNAAVLKELSAAEKTYLEAMGSW